MLRCLDAFGQVNAFDSVFLVIGSCLLIASNLLVLHILLTPQDYDAIHKQLVLYVLGIPQTIMLSTNNVWTLAGVQHE